MNAGIREDSCHSGNSQSLQGMGFGDNWWPIEARLIGPKSCLRRVKTRNGEQRSQDRNKKASGRNWTAKAFWEVPPRTRARMGHGIDLKVRRPVFLQGMREEGRPMGH